ncbi:hypothetical protein PHJA_002235200 [Phtheirospermum japonicum]|uniref:Uncharacterized protein n=1 Tax=Phtheirospermum japonicum TaxID=374723 RepID=A0A830CRT2_9LAMI|nr:hypothetical protein PHJA_002235200 [Phtheirospermum japonicum]
MSSSISFLLFNFFLSFFIFLFFQSFFLSRSRTLLFILLAILLGSSFPPSISASDEPSGSSIYEVLSTHDLPMGLLPKGVKNFSYNNSKKFEVHLDRACNAKFENELHYDTNVSGPIRYGQINELSGITEVCTALEFARELVSSSSLCPHSSKWYLILHIRRLLLFIPRSQGELHFFVDNDDGS